MQQNGLMLLMILTPDELQSQIYKNHIEQRMKQGYKPWHLLMDLNIHFNLIKARKDLDVFMIAPKGPGHLVRSEYQKRRRCFMFDGNSPR